MESFCSCLGTLGELPENVWRTSKGSLRNFQGTVQGTSKGMFGELPGGSLGNLQGEVWGIYRSKFGEFPGESLRNIQGEAWGISRSKF